jgi:hypothetical protein
MPLVNVPYGVSLWLPESTKNVAGVLELLLVSIATDTPVKEESRLYKKGVCGPPVLISNTPEVSETNT